MAYAKGFYYKPGIDFAMLQQYHEGLFISDGCMLSRVSRAIVNDDLDSAYEWERKLIEIFGKDNVLSEIHTWQFCNPKTEEQVNLNNAMQKTDLFKLKIAKDLGIKIIAANDAHYAKREDWQWHELE